ncbi:hypothetical protein TIFTF001_039058 [Ficus carica]|uniref:Uncharacterized protein n=1 Tax=Ficus carica TaxID=3494 RepID=A0AA88JEN4_FICCA|nr:hypothetical protein TIFTF001_039058 [Ficus carica]
MHDRGSRRLVTMRATFTMVRGSSRWQIWVHGAWFTEIHDGLSRKSKIPNPPHTAAANSEPVGPPLIVAKESKLAA